MARRPTRASTRLRTRQQPPSGVRRGEGSDFDEPVGTGTTAKNGHDRAAGDEEGAGGGGRVHGRRRLAVAEASSERRRRKSAGSASASDRAARSFGTDVSNLPPPASGGGRTGEKKWRRSKDTTTAASGSKLISKDVASSAAKTAVRSPNMATAGATEANRKNYEKGEVSTRGRRGRRDSSRSAEYDREIEEGKGGNEEVSSRAEAGEGIPTAAEVTSVSPISSSSSPPSTTMKGSPFGSISPIPAEDGTTPRRYRDADDEEEQAGDSGGSGSTMQLCSSDDGGMGEDGSDDVRERRMGARQKNQYPATTPGRRSRERIRTLSPGGECWSQQERNRAITREIDLMSSEWGGRDGVGDEKSSSPDGSRSSRHSGTVDTSNGGTEEYFGRDGHSETSKRSGTSTSRRGAEEEERSFGTVDTGDERDADGGEAFEGSQHPDTIDTSQGGTEDSLGASEADRRSGTVDTGHGGAEGKGASKGGEKEDVHRGESSPSATIIRNDAERLLKQAKNSPVDDQLVMSAMLNSGKKGRRTSTSGRGSHGDHGDGRGDAAALVMGRPRTERVVGTFPGSAPTSTPRGAAIGPMETFTIERRDPDEESVCSEVTAATLDSVPPVDDDRRRGGDGRAMAGREEKTSAGGSRPGRRSGGSHEAPRPRQQRRAQVPKRAVKASRASKNKTARYGRRRLRHTAELSSIPEAPEGSSGEDGTDEDADERVAVDHAPDGRSRRRTSPPNPIQTSRSGKRRSPKERGRRKLEHVHDDEDDDEVPSLECEDDRDRHVDDDEDDYGNPSAHEVGGSNDVIEDEDDERSVLERCVEKAGHSERRTHTEKRRRSSASSGRKRQIRKKTPVSTGKIRMAHVHPICSLQKLGALLVKAADTKSEKSRKTTSTESERSRNKSFERRRPRTKSTERKRSMTKSKERNRPRTKSKERKKPRNKASLVYV